MPRKLSDRVRFGSFELDLRAGELHGDGRSVVLHDQPFQVLLMLIERDGEIATREEIKKKLWPNDTVVEFDHSINAAIGKLRRALDDAADDPQYIQKVSRRESGDGPGLWKMSRFDGKIERVRNDWGIVVPSRDGKRTAIHADGVWIGTPGGPERLIVSDESTWNFAHFAWSPIGMRLRTRRLPSDELLD